MPLLGALLGGGSGRVTVAVVVAGPVALAPGHVGEAVGEAASRLLPALDGETERPVRGSLDPAGFRKHTQLPPHLVGGNDHQGCQGLGAWSLGEPFTGEPEQRLQQIVATTLAFHVPAT